MNDVAQSEPTKFRFTGWHMLASMLAFFGVIISVNVFMAWNAISSWSGLVVPNTYVASQQFNGKAEAAKARAALGIKGTINISSGQINYHVTHPTDSAYQPDRVSLNFRRPVGEEQNFDLVLAPTAPGAFAALHTVPDGQWIVESIVIKDGATVVHEGERIMVRGGVQ